MVTPQARSLGDTLRKCRRCKQVHPLTQYYKNKKYADGKDTMCRFCLDRSHYDYVARNRWKIREYHRRIYVPVPKKEPAQERPLRILPEHLQRYIDEPLREGKTYEEYLAALPEKTSIKVCEREKK